MTKKELIERKKEIDASKFKAGLYIETREKNELDETFTRIKYYCNCGNNTDEQVAVGFVRVNINHTCSECGNKYFSSYNKSSVKMGFKYDKYPDSLKRAHDVKMVNYRVFKGEKDSQDFINSVRQYNDLIYVGQKYQIVVPRNEQDLVREGSMLHHCIASYKDRVIKGRSKILFMRNIEDVSEPLVSIELNNNYNLVQSRGVYNRALRKEEKDFILEWTEFVDDTLTKRRKIDKKSEIESFN